MLKFLLLPFFICFATAIIAAEKTITTIEISGLKRTNESVVRNAINIQEGDSLDNFNESEVRTSLNRLGLFSNIDISTLEDEQGAIVKIALKEKITKLILPLAKSGTNETAVGLIFLDSNFLARGDTFIAIAVYGKSTNLYSIVFDNKHFLDTNFTNKVFLSYDSSQLKNQQVLNPDIQLEYSQKTARGGYAFGYDFGKFSTLMGFSYKNFKISNKTTDNMSGETYSVAPSVSIDKMTYTDFLAHGFDGRVSVARNRTHLDTNTIYSTAFSGQTSYSFKTADRNKILAGFDVLLSDLPFVEQSRTGYGRGMRSLVDRNISYQNFLGGTLSNEYLFHYNSTFGFSNITFIETGKINGEFNKHYVAYTGVGSGVNIYFKKVAIPAVGLYITNNFRTHATQVIFVMGMSI
ncbi:MAG: hypothetical protein LBQ34_06400 [Alphaproteobacteria bacterium]|jgi:hypothetical protein|nr:hypothetical protein [Alphaproteobacteria bacterium]